METEHIGGNAVSRNTVNCAHTHLTEQSTAYGKWSWELSNGSYDPVGQFEITSEDSDGFTCDDCGAKVWLDQSAQLEEVEAADA